MIERSDDDLATPRRGLSRAVSWAKPALFMALGAVLVWTGRASSQVGEACTEVLPAPLVPFCPRTPARASDMNHNFRTVAGWIEQKVGALGTGDVTIRGAVNVPPGSIDGTEIADGSVALADLAPAVVGAGLRTSGGSIQVDPSWLAAQIDARIRARITLSGPYEVRYEMVEDWYVYRTRATGVSTTNGACFIVGVQVTDDNDEDDTTHCEIVDSGGQWTVRAWGNANDRPPPAGEVVCTARCLSW